MENAASLRRRFRRLRLFYFIYLIAAIAALISYFIDRRVTLAVLGVSAVYHMAVVRPCSRAYSRAFIHTAALATLNAHLTDAVHTASPVLAPDELRLTALFPADNTKSSIMCHEGATGSFNGCKVRLGDVTVTISFTAASGKLRHEFINGLWVAVKPGRQSLPDCRIFGKNALSSGAMAKLLRQCGGAEAAKLPNGMSALFDDDQPALPKPFLTALERLDRAVDGWFAVAVSGGSVHVFLHDRILGQKVNARIAPSPDIEKADLLPELTLALKLSDPL